MIKLEIKSYNTILREKQQKYQHQQQAKLINTNILQVKNEYLTDQGKKQRKVIEDHKKTNKQKPYSYLLKNQEIRFLIIQLNKEQNRLQNQKKNLIMLN